MENENEEYDFSCTQIDDTVVQHQFSGTQVDSDVPAQTRDNINDSNNNIIINDNNDDHRDGEIVGVDEQTCHIKQIEVADKEDDDKEDADDEEEEDEDDDEESISQGAKVPKMGITQDMNPLAQKSEDDDNIVNEENEEEDGVNHVQEVAVVERNAGTLVNAEADDEEKDADEKKDADEEEDDEDDDEDDDEESISQGAKAVPKMDLGITQDLHPFSPAYDRKNHVQDDGEDDDADNDAAADDDAIREGKDGADHNDNDNDDDDELLQDIHNDHVAADEDAAEDDTAAAAAADMGGTRNDHGSAMVLLTGSSTAMVILTGSSTTSGRGAGEGHMTNDNTCLEDPYGGSSSPTQYTPGLPLPAPKPQQRPRGHGPSPSPGAGSAHAGGVPGAASDMLVRQNRNSSISIQNP